MTPRLILALALLAATQTLTACAPVAIGAAGAIIADEVMENEGGGDGLF